MKKVKRSLAGLLSTLILLSSMPLSAGAAVSEPDPTNAPGVLEVTMDGTDDYVAGALKAGVATAAGGFGSYDETDVATLIIDASATVGDLDAQDFRDLALDTNYPLLENLDLSGATYDTVSMSADMLASEEIPANAFDGNGVLKNITLPTATVGIDADAFDNMASLELISLEGNAQPAFDLDDGIFNGVDGVVIDMGSIAYAALSYTTDWAGALGTATNVTLKVSAAEYGSYVADTDIAAAITAGDVEMYKGPIELTGTAGDLAAVATDLADGELTNAIDMAIAVYNAENGASEAYGSITSIEVAGNVTDTDLTWLNGNLTALETLDLSEALLNEGTGAGTEGVIAASQFAGGSLAALETVVMPKNLVEVGVNAFDGLAALETVDFTSVVDNGGVDIELGDEAFVDCDALTAVDMTGVVVKFAAGFDETDIFKSVANTDNVATIVIKVAASDMPAYIANWDDLKAFDDVEYEALVVELTEDTANPGEFSAETTGLATGELQDQVELALAIYNWDNNLTGTAVIDASNILELIVDGDIEDADLDYIASDLESLTDLDMSAAALNDGAANDGVIKQDQFKTDSTTPVLPDLVNVSMPKNLVTVSEGVFNGHDKLETVDFSAATSAPIELEKDAFAGCIALEELNCEGVEVKFEGSNTFADVFSNGAKDDFKLVIIPADYAKYGTGTDWDNGKVALEDNTGAPVTPPVVVKPALDKPVFDATATDAATYTKAGDLDDTATITMNAGDAGKLKVVVEDPAVSGTTVTTADNTYQWYTEDDATSTKTAIPSATTDTLDLSGMTAFKGKIFVEVIAKDNQATTTNSDSPVLESKKIAVEITSSTGTAPVKPVIEAMDDITFVEATATNQVLTANASVSDNGTLTYAWVIEDATGAAVTTVSSTTDTLDVTTLTEGVYTVEVEVTNAATADGPAISEKTDATVTVLAAGTEADAPVVGADFANDSEYEVKEGTPNKLSADVTDSNGSYTYEWIQVAEDGTETPVPGATGKDLDLDALNLAEGTYTYYVKVTNNGPTNAGYAPATVESGKFVVTVPPVTVPVVVDAPTITTQPASAEYVQDDEDAVIADLKVVAESGVEGATLAYQWFKDGAEISGATTDTLKTGTDIKVVGRNAYTVAVKNVLNGDESEAVVSDAAVIEVVDKNADVTVKFVSLGEAYDKDQTVKVGEKIKKPATDPKKPDDGKTKFVFVGWYIDEDCTKAFDFDKDVVTKSITLYAGFAEIKDVKFASFIEGDKNAKGDRTMRPYDNITRKEAAQMLYNLLTDEEIEKIEDGDTKEFDDVKKGDWFFDAVTVLSSMNGGVIKGDDKSDTFRPHANLTRMEFASMLQIFLELEDGTTMIFKDMDDEKPSKVTEDNWGWTAVAALGEAGISVGDDKGNYNPTQKINRAGVITMLNKVYDREPQDVKVFDGVTNPFVDVVKGDWTYVQVMGAGVGFTEARPDMTTVSSAATADDADADADAE